MKTVAYCLLLVGMLACRSPETVAPAVPPHDPFTPEQGFTLQEDAAFGGKLRERWRVFQYRTDFYFRDTLVHGTDSLSVFIDKYMVGHSYQSSKVPYTYAHYFSFRSDATFYEEAGPYLEPNQRSGEHSFQQGTYQIEEDVLTLRQRNAEFWRLSQGDWKLGHSWNPPAESFRITQFTTDTLRFVSKYYLDPGFDEPFYRPKTLYTYEYILIFE